MKTDYITSTPTLPPHMVYPRFLLGMDLRLITKEVYAILLDMTVNGEASVDKHGRRYLTLICYNKVVTVVANEKNIRKEVGNMTQNYTPEFRKKIVRLHEEEGRTYKSITAEYGVSKASICKWCSELRKECQTSEQAKADYNSMKENLRLKRENEELRKENAFLKKAAAFFAKEIG